jgi:Mg2+-importing ATPase
MTSVATRDLAPAEVEFWNAPLRETLEQAGDGKGLSSAGAAERRRTYGRNEAVAVRRVPIWRKFLVRINNPLILILLLASGLSAITGDVASFVIVTIVVLLSVGLDVLQEHNAEHTMEALARSVALRAEVFRDGAEVEIPAAELVPGDIVHLAAGDLVPADCRLLETHDLSVDQALLTGEPYPVEKEACDLTEASEDPAKARNAIFMATSVLSGRARAVVCRTGARTALGHLAGTLIAKAPTSAFAAGVQNFGMLMLRLTVFLVLFVLLTNVLFERPWLQSLMFALALAVGLTPELLPAIVTVTLARGARRMAERKVVVKQLAAIHNLGAMDVLCTDKTGTLTEARIRLARHVDYRGEDSPHVLEMAHLNSAFSGGIRSALDQAILDHPAPDLSAWTRIDEVPFDFQRRRVSVLAARAGARWLIVKGAPEDILARSVAYATAPEETAPLDEAAHAILKNLFERLSREGFRLLAVATRAMAEDRTTATPEDEAELTFVGFVAFFDPPKASAAAAIRGLADLGIVIRVLTGDNELVTRHVCAELGIAVDGVITGEELAQLGEPALLGRIDRTNIFCRVTPQQKQRVILALKKRGHAVGYLGDGINDAPALHAADVGLSVDSGADVAKEAASVILLRQDLSVVRDGVIEGRRAVENTTKYILMGTSSNFGNMLSMAGAGLFLPFLPMLPIQVLLNNLLYDVSELGIPFDSVDQESIQRPVHWDLGLVKRFMLVLGPISSVFDFLTFYVLLHVFHTGSAEFQTGWFVESLATQALVVFAIRSRRLFGSAPHLSLVALTCGAVLLAAALPFSPLGALLGFVPLPLPYYAFLVAAVVSYIGVVEAVKRVLFRVRPSPRWVARLGF